MSNFYFLEQEKEYSLFSSAAIEAERVYSSAPAMCAVGCRKALELAVKWVYSADSTMSLPYRDNLQSLIHEPSFRFEVDQQTWKNCPLSSSSATWQSIQKSIFPAVMCFLH